MAFTLCKALRLSNRLPAFLVPVFLNDQDGLFYAQYSGRENKILRMLRVPEIYLTEENIETLSEKDKCKVDLGDEAIYMFAYCQSKIITGVKNFLIQDLERKYKEIDATPTVKLAILSFIDAGGEEKLAALAEISSLIEDEEIRKQFFSLESSFIYINDLEIKIDNKISELKVSGSFATTHALVSNLVGLIEHFKPRQVRAAIEACLSNNQVHWIASDPDVKGFTSTLYRTGHIKLTDFGRQKLGISDAH